MTRSIRSLHALSLALVLAMIASLAACGDNLPCVGDECNLVEVELCDATGDEDGDGAADCADTDCAAAPECQPVCGNGIQNVGEGCDDMNTTNTDACTNTCQRARCGDNIIQAGVEMCDDGNTVDTDACTSVCVPARCGDGIVGPGEQCDDANMVNTDACTNACRNAVCGDGAIGPGEECDDGNLVDTDACTAMCDNAICGDMIVRTGVEQCDDGNMVNTDACTNTCLNAACGDGFVGPGEACDDGNMVNTDACTNACALPSCGDGFMQAGEQCDDGNMVNTDACLNTCMTASCGDGVTRAGVEECDDMNQVDTDACRNTCVDAECGDGVIEVGVDECDDGNMVNTDACTNACTTARCGDMVVGPGESCDDGNMINGDGCDNTCQPSGCGNGVIGGAETCDDGNTTAGDGCGATCLTEAGFTCNMVPSVCVTTCGDGVTAGAEQCDQGNGNVMNGDGCSALCQLEPGFACGGTPSVCAASCGNGALNANELCDDGNLVNGDGCSPTCRFDIGCAAGETQVVVTNNTPVPIADSMTVTSSVMIQSNALVSRMVVYLGNLTHTFDGDLDISLLGPRMISRDLTSDNGGLNDNYVRTFLDDAASVPVQAGAAPFTGRFKPEQTLSAGGFRGQLVGGTWTLSIADDTGGDTGTLTSWTLVACTTLQVPRCGNSNIDAGEECDDGNDVASDMCNNSCGLVDGCGDGNIDMGEQCDDDNRVAGDGCAANCTVDIGCPMGQVAVTTSNNMMQAIPDNDLVTGVSSAVAVAQLGGVQTARVFVSNITHATNAHVDIHLLGPNGVQRELSTDNGGVNYVNTTFEDLGPYLITDTTNAIAPFSGSFRPEQSLNTTIGTDFRRVSALGNWTLRVFDDTAGTTGTFNGWTLLMCVDPTQSCGDMIVNGGEECDDGNLVPNDMCTNLCQITDGCGDGNLDAGEQCDDDNIVSGDGCSSMCQVDITCPVGQVAVNVSNNNMAAIPDNDLVVGVSSVAAVAQLGGVTSAKVLIKNITHTGVGDIDMSLIAPNGIARELSTDNGGLGDNFINTVFFDGAATAITSGSVPYTGVFRPEQSLTTTFGTDFSRLKANGNWTLRIFDDAGGDTGSLNGWSLIMCVDPTQSCGDMMVNGGEECDDGNTVNTDACSNTCQVVDGCGDGNIDVNELCDDNNVVAGDGCSANCMPDISCAPGEMPVIVANSMATPIPDNLGGVVSAIPIMNAGLVRKAIVTLAITHANTSHLDVYLFSPRGGQRVLTQDRGTANYVATMFSDAAPTAISAGTSPYTGTFRPEQTLDGFNNQQAAGDWLLRIGDDTSGTTGVLGAWALALCIDPTAPRVCGNGIVETLETCDDGNVVANDGCSNLCQIELSCAVGQVPLVFTSNDEKAVIPDGNAAGITSNIAVVGVGNVQKAVAVINAIGHSYTGDVNLTLISPMMTNIDLSSGNGSSGDDFLSTMFADAATTLITAGSPTAVAPFRGRFKPEGSLPSLNGQPAGGMWGLKVVDAFSIDTGALRSWTIGLCAGP